MESFLRSHSKGVNQRFLKPYSESVDKTGSDEPKISISFFYYTLLAAARFQTERLYLNFGDDHYRFLGFQMVGDVIFKYAAWLDATKFAAAGADVYLYHFDLDGRGDVFINGSSCCGLGHAKELTYTYAFFVLNL